MQAPEEMMGPENYGKLGLHIAEILDALETSWMDPVYDRPQTRLNDDVV
jgi:hypothetical protein